MSLLNAWPLEVGAVGINPSGWLIETNDSLYTVTTTGYLTPYQPEYNFKNFQFANVQTTDGTFYLGISISNGEVSFTYNEDPSQTAANIAGGTTNSVLYQVSPSNTGFISSSNETVLIFNESGLPVASDELPDGINLGTPSAGNLENCNIPSGAITGIISLENGGTGSDLSATGGSSNVLRQNVLGGNITVSQLEQDDIYGLETTSSPEFFGLTISSLTPSHALVTDSQSNVVTVGYSTNVTASNLVQWDNNSNLQSNNLTYGYAITATSGGTTTLTAASGRDQLFTGSSTQTVVMPVTSSLSVNFTYFISNQSSGILTINASDGSLIKTLPSNNTALIKCISTGVTSNAAWVAFTNYASGGSVTSVGLSVPASSIFGVTGSPVTTSGNLTLTTSGTSGGIPYFSSLNTLSSTAALNENSVVVGGGFLAGPSTISSSTNAVLSSSAGGVPSFSTTLPSGLTIPSPTISSATLSSPTLGTPNSGNLSNCTSLPISTGVSGLGTNVATFLATPTSANLAAAVTNETGTGSLVFATSPSLVTPSLGAATATSVQFTTSGTINYDYTANSGSSFSLSPANGTSQGITLTSDCTVTLASNPSSTTEREMIVDFIQDGTGSRAITWSNITWSSGGPPIINTVAGSTTTIYFKGTTRGWVGYSMPSPTDSGQSVLFGQVSAFNSSNTTLLTQGVVGVCQYATLCNNVSTTDATTTTIQTITIPTASSFAIRGFVKAVRTGGSAGSTGDSGTFFIQAGIKNPSGTASVIGGGVTTYTDQSWTVALSVSGPSILVRVTGAVNNNITWTLFLETF